MRSNDGGTNPTPTWRRRLAPVAVLAIAVMIAFGGYLGAQVVGAQDGTPESYEAKANRTVYAGAAAAGAEGYTLELVSVTIDPGVALDPHTHPGTQLAHIAAGELTYTVLTGEIELRRAPAEGEDEGEVIMMQAGETYTLMPGDTVIEQPGNAHQAANNGDVAVEIVISSLFPEGAAPSDPYVEGTPTT